MNKDLLIDGEKFISAKRASQDLGYSMDYIGQLARAGTVTGKMVGRSWYVSRRSLMSYKKTNGAEKTSKVGRPVESGKKDLYLNGEKFISSVVAARETGYTTDYIGQLARSGAVEGKLIARTWYVSRKSLLSYKRNNSAVPRVISSRDLSPKIKPIALPKVVAAPTVRIPKIEKPAPVVKTFSYASEHIAPLPKLSKEKEKMDYSLLVRSVVSVSLSVTIIVGVAYSWMGYIAPEAADAVNVRIAQTLDRADAVTEAVGAKVAQVVNPVKVGSSHLALSIGSGVREFFSGVLPVTPQAKSEPASQPVGQGIVVTSENGDHSSAVERIKRIFSDQVVVNGDPDGASGIITPVFTASTSTEQYTYVLVPIQEKKTE